MTKPAPKLLILLLALLIGGSIIAAKAPAEHKQYDYVTIVQIFDDLHITNGPNFETVSLKGNKRRSIYQFSSLFAKVNEFEAQGYEVLQNSVYTAGDGTYPRNYVLMRKPK
jgi:hypothetical protein